MHTAGRRFYALLRLAGCIMRYASILSVCLLCLKQNVVNGLHFAASGPTLCNSPPQTVRNWVLCTLEVHVILQSLQLLCDCLRCQRRCTNEKCCLLTFYL